MSTGVMCVSKHALGRRCVSVHALGGGACTGQGGGCLSRGCLPEGVSATLPHCPVHGEIHTPNACWNTHPPAQAPRGQTPPPSVATPLPPQADTPSSWADTPQAHTTRANDPRWPLQRTVFILLECILVHNAFLFINTSDNA